MEDLNYLPTNRLGVTFNLPRRLSAITYSLKLNNLFNRIWKGFVFMEKRREIYNCNVCGGSEFIPKFRETLHHSDIVTCKTCGFVFSNPQVEVDYSGHDNYLKGHLATEKGRRLTSQWRLKQIPKQITSGRLFEVGCSVGFFLCEARKKGFEVIGHELNKGAVNYARDVLKLNVCDDADFTGIDFGGKFDVIAMFDVLEHLPDPKEALTYLADNWLAENGVILIEVPNIFSLPSKLFGENDKHLQFAHYSYYSPNTFEMLIKQCGLEMVNFQYGKRVYPLLNLVFPYFARTPLLRDMMIGLLKMTGLGKKVVTLGLHEFLFFTCKLQTGNKAKI